MKTILFPADRRLAEVKRCSALLQALHGEEANRFWRSEMIHFVAAMRIAGAEDEDIRAQAGLFLKAVQIELEIAAGRETSVGG
ncbi:MULTISPECIES: DUF6074 family protein [Rhizobium]|uniref:Uncharacterized protein n=2 Tax=Rhizobium TaxID=379 RepID=A0A387G2Y9_9HYPH|nr:MULTISPECIES: DUF6074 family protein [Rhizobium]AYG64177.1 hypothetical protein CCGE525_36100 [Rhizobium jaguaris]MDL2403023.1 DUF6074 family protein [Rhizobium mayense]